MAATIDALKATHVTMSIEIADLMAENARLREASQMVVRLLDKCLGEDLPLSRKAMHALLVASRKATGGGPTMPLASINANRPE